MGSKIELEMAGIKRIPTSFSYSQAVGAGDFVFLGFHRGWGADFTAQFHDMFSRLKNTLAEFDLTLAHLVQVDIRFKHVADIRVYEKLFREYFEKDKYPARIGGSTEFFDDNCLVMIGGIAYRGDP
jgi:2-iminobutanoate/2-iminopropanoate deaminase